METFRLLGKDDPQKFTATTETVPPDESLMARMEFEVELPDQPSGSVHAKVLTPGIEPTV
jgi:hypothetical protein